MINVFFDTNIIISEGLNSYRMQMLLRLVRREKVRIYTSEMVTRECLSRNRIEINDELQSASRKFSKIEEKKSFSGEKNDKLKKIITEINELQRELDVSLDESMRKWIDKYEVDLERIYFGSTIFL